MAETARRTEVPSVADATEPTLKSIALDHDQACWLNPVPLRFDPLGLPAEIDPYEDETPCSSVAEKIEERTGLPACRWEGPLVRTLGETFAAFAAAKVMGPRGLVGPPLPVVTTPPKGKLKLKDSPRSRVPSGFAHFEQDPWTYVHSIQGRPVVEIRNPGSSMADVHVYDRRGKEVILTSRILVKEKRDIMIPSSKEGLRQENVPTLKAFIAQNKDLLAPHPKVRFEGTR